MSKPQKTGSFLKTGRSRSTNAAPNYALVQPGTLNYAEAANPSSVVVDQGGNPYPLMVPTTGEASKVPLAFIGNGTVTGVFEQGANTKEARIRFACTALGKTGKTPAVNAVVAITISGDAVSLTDVTGNSALAGFGPGRASGHLQVADPSGTYSGVVLFNSTGIKRLILQYGLESYVLQLNVT